jgi:hypothetical protein
LFDGYCLYQSNADHDEDQLNRNDSDGEVSVAAASGSTSIATTIAGISSLASIRSAGGFG